MKRLTRIEVSVPLPGARRDSRYPWLVVAVLMLVYTCGYIDRYALTIVLDQVKQSLHASDAYMGFLAGPAFAVFFTLASLPVARLADRYSRVTILALGCATWSGFTLLCAMAETKLGFTLARLGVGLGEATCLARRLFQSERLSGSDRRAVDGRRLECGAGVATHVPVHWRAGAGDRGVVLAGGT